MFMLLNTHFYVSSLLFPLRLENQYRSKDRDMTMADQDNVGIKFGTGWT